ncbi:MAG: multidrug effflux MFS transporter [Sphingobium sp.]
MGNREFVIMMAALMSIAALSIDMMLPALPQIGQDLRIADPNDRQSIVTVFLFGLAFGSLFYGPLSDRFGRRRILMLAACLQLIATLTCALATSFPMLLGARLLAGFSVASCRVVAMSIVRDCFRGDAMARVMSLIMVTFIIVPVLAPSAGSLVLLVAPWRWIFGLLLIMIIVLAVWQFLRLPETLPPEHRARIGPRDLWATFMTVMGNRNSIGHMLASGIMMGGLIGFLVSIQQIFFDVFDAGRYFAAGFAAIAIWMGFGSLLNSRLVERFGARRLSQIAVIVLVAVSALHCLIVLSGHEHLVTFIIIQSITTTCFSFSGANFSSISLEPFTRGAGLAASVQAALTTLISTVLGGLVGASFDGTVLPMSLGFLAFGGTALFLIAWAERWKLFQRPGYANLRKENYILSDRG